MHETAGESPWWSTERHLARRPFLAARGEIKRAVRTWFEEAGFTDVTATAEFGEADVRDDSPRWFFACKKA